MYKHIILTALALSLALAPAWASNRTCNTDLVVDGACVDSTSILLHYEASIAGWSAIVDAFAADQNWQPELICAPSRQFEPLLNGQPSNILSAAGVAEDGCTSGQVTSNPQSQGDFTDAVILRIIQDAVIQHQLDEATASAGDPTTISTPEVQ